MQEEPFFEQPADDDAVTLGPEEILQREIEKSKSLKTERLRLKDEIEKLQAQAVSLSEENQNLKRRIQSLENQNPSHHHEPGQKPTLEIRSAGWVFFLLIFNLTALGLLLFLTLNQ